MTDDFFTFDFGVEGFEQFVVVGKSFPDLTDPSAEGCVFSVNVTINDQCSASRR